MDVELADFEDAYADFVVGWVRSAREADDWASLDEGSLDRSVFATWHDELGVVPCVGLVGDAVCAYGEVWEDHAEQEAELARIIVAPHRRGQGIGRRFVSLLVSEAERRGFAAIWLRVVPLNRAAIACYRGAGFERATTAEEAAFNANQPRGYVWMRHAGSAS